jgi:hypothetical protein
VPVALGTEGQARNLADQSIEHGPTPAILGHGLRDRQIAV